MDSPSYSPSNISKLEPSTEIYCLSDGKCTKLETDFTINISKPDNTMEELTNSDLPCGLEENNLMHCLIIIYTKKMNIN